ncbi:hypothetical protein BT63DRAFT_382000 [Microthyrium microscopicum]|uniref:Chromatin modification-related protein n=1 Tax=Microthyrium microscopicum TaxID=703497 RepID=A0A6A6UTZ6_9PEZI|nr:hypothetical protein BT63DRAFT_382000 [Microthyrium microscopicum]
MSVTGGRRQSARAVRTTAPRPQNYYARTFSNPVEASTPTDAQPGFFPALTHFTDSVDALPREIMRHFSMMKEVEAKLYQPEEDLARLAEQMAKLPQRAPTTLTNGDSSNSHDDSVSAESPTDLPESERLPLYRRLNFSLHSMGPVLDEKIAVLSTANMELARQLDRLESSFVHISEEVSKEARLGNPNHWAYVTEKETKKPVHERPRREAAAANNYVGGSGDGDHGARSELRKEALMARKNRNQHQDSDFEERPMARKPKGKSAKTTETQGIADPRSTGLGIANGTGQGKRKKAAPTVQPMERSISTALGGQRRPAGSPTPGVEAQKKRKAAPGPLPSKKRLQVADGKSPRPFSSPLVGTFNVREPIQRAGHSRGRNGSQSNAAQVLAETATARPSSSTATMRANVPSALGAPSPLATMPNEVKSATVPPADTSASNGKTTVEAPSILKREEVDTPEDAPAAEVEPAQSVPVATRTGRASKTATPVVGAFPDDAARAPSRAARAKESVTGNGSHASSESGGAERTTAVREKRKRVATRKVENGGDEADGEDVEDEEEEADGDEPRYCYCNEVSYGVMVACDSATCARQWFHLRCAGLREAPTTAKWYCEDCKTAMKESRRIRPTSSRRD